jgi:hypothetical protein
MYLYVDGGIRLISRCPATAAINDIIAAAQLTLGAEYQSTTTGYANAVTASISGLRI